ncbi:hypothetical protein SAMN05216207_10836 [Pseudonocardia ammonioxydans]|uniref:Uncharacterized protein n=1 Tax=Pseudonocardia ammonioxydans TaxID=260086 RepID=A0A1I5I1F5_PSUAM|nr:hypothetical protein [Pseudonocardia ammonioxydans]SFO54373.1 hypothetical protein SAMN05216207_10836 [Pseudonocardia ammonioxydans]
MSSPHDGGRLTASRGTRIPVTIWIAVCCWLALALCIFFAAGDAFADGVPEPQADVVSAQLGAAAVADPPTLAASGFIAVTVALAMLGLVLALLCRRGWSRVGLVGVGAFALITLAWDGRWQVLPAFGLLLLGSVALMHPATHRALLTEAE